MALTGLFYGTTSNQFVKPCITWSVVQNAEENYSDVTAVLTYSRTNTGYKTESTWYGGISIDGVYQNGSVFATVTYNSNTQVFSCTQRVYHNEDGTREVTIWADGYFFNTKTYNTSISAVISLDAIAQSARVAATDAVIGGVSTVMVSGLLAGCTYTVRAQFGQLSGYLDGAGQMGDAPVYLTADTIPFSVPESFYYEIPESPQGVCALTCTTYLDGAPAAQAQECTFTVTADKNRCAPLLAPEVTDCNPVTLALTGDAAKLVRCASTALCVMGAQGQYGASIVQRRIGEITLQEDTGEITGVESPELTFWVKDSRGYEASQTVTPEMIAYLPLTLNASVSRTDPTGSTGILTAQGQCFCGAFGQQDNTLTVSYAVDGGTVSGQTVAVNTDNSYCVQIPISGLTYDRHHTVQVFAQDLVREVSLAPIGVGKGTPVFDWGENDFNFHVPVNFEKGFTARGSLADLLYPVGSVYISVAQTEPSVLFGGTWEQIKDVFLLSAGDIYANGATGGEAAHTLTVEEMPSHTHASQGYAYAGGSGAYTVLATNGDDTDKTTLPTGGGQSHNNMPPYLAVYMWKRTA